MKSESNQINPKMLGVIGKEHFERWLIENNYDALEYKIRNGYTRNNLPFIVEVAFGIYFEEKRNRKLICGLNWSPIFNMPFDYYTTSLLLEDNYIESHDPVCLIIHIACPNFEYTDRGKAKIDLDYNIKLDLKKCVELTAKKWANAKKTVKREEKRMHKDKMEKIKNVKRQQLTVKDAAFRIMEAAYLKASGSKNYPANARQIMYAARPLVQQLRNREETWKNSSYFTQILLPEFVEANPEITFDWDVVYDARGNLIEPHTGERIEIGTLAIRRYIKSWTKKIDYKIEHEIDYEINTTGPKFRYNNVLFVEKEGFNEILKVADIANKYDIAIMSTKGMSVTAARQLVQELTKEDVAIYVLHDFDKSGITIYNTLKTDTRRFKFEITPKVIDIGLRLEDVQQMNLENEEVSYSMKKDPRINLIQNGATKDECNFLVEERISEKKWIGRRVELNAMTSDQFIRFLEDKLTSNGVKKVIPDEVTVKKVYQRNFKILEMQKRVDEILNKPPEDEDLPDDLMENLKDKLKSTSDSWDTILFDIAEEIYKENECSKILSDFPIDELLKNI